MAFGKLTVLNNHHLCLVPKHFHHLQKNFVIKQLFPIPPFSSPSQNHPSVYVLSLLIYLSWMLHKIGIMQCVTLYVWLLWLSVICFVFICVLLVLHFLGWMIFRCMYTLHFAYPFIHWWTWINAYPFILWWTLSIHPLMNIHCIHSSVSGHLGCYHDLAIVNSAAVSSFHLFIAHSAAINSHVRIFNWIPILNSYNTSFHVFVNHLHNFFREMSIQVLCPF